VDLPEHLMPQIVARWVQSGRYFIATVQGKYGTPDDDEVMVAWKGLTIKQLEVVVKAAQDALDDKHRMR